MVYFYSSDHKQYVPNKLKISFFNILSLTSSAHVGTLVQVILLQQKNKIYVNM